MKLTYFQLEAHLTKSLSSIYIVSGDDVWLKQDAIKLIRKAAQGAAFNERTRLTAESGFDWEQLYSTLYSTSLFTPKQCIELIFRDTWPNKTASNILVEYADNPTPPHLLLIETNKIDSKIAKTLWYQTLEKKGVAVAIWPIPREQLPQWIINRAKKYKLSFDRAVANALADYTEGNVMAAAQAIEKIYLLQLENPIDINLIENILTDESHFTVFDLVENIIAGKAARALQILDHLKTEGTEPTLVLWAITRELRLLAELANQLQQGTTYERLFQTHKIFSHRQTAIRRFLTTFSAKDCWHYLARAAQIDQLIKGAAPGEPWDALQLFCLRLV